MPKSLVSVKNVETDEVLFQCSIQELEQAYSYAVDMEALGLNVVIDTPTVTKTLADSLGVKDKQAKAFEASVNEEIESHDAMDTENPNI